MKALFYESMIKASRLTGIWIIAFFAWFISSAVFFLSPKMVACGLHFYKALFPEKTLPARVLMVWRQFHHFSTVFVDRVRLERKADIVYETIGLEAFEAHRNREGGGIFLMSHFGNWEIAARLFHRQDLSLMLHLGQREKEQIEKRQKKDLAQEGIRIVAASEEDASPFDLIESVRLLRQGGYVSIAGDRVQNEKQRKIEAPFLGHSVHIPAAPHLLAMLSGAPIFMLFTIRLKAGHYKVIVSRPYYVKKGRHRNRDDRLKESISTYLYELQQMITAHPDHWYHFEPFIH